MLSTLRRSQWRPLQAYVTQMIRTPEQGREVQSVQSRNKSTESQEHKQQRIAHEADMKALRKQWIKERDASSAEQRRQEEVEEIRLKGVREAREVRIQKKRQRIERAAAALARKRAASEAVRLQKAAEWREALDQVYARHRRTRTNQLTEDSRNWIRPEDLDARIEEALDNPVDLYQ